MKIPAPHTCAHAILESVYLGGEKTKGQLVRLLDGRFVRQTAEDKINELIINGMLVAVDGNMRISIPVRRYFEQCEMDRLDLPKSTGSVATPRIAKPFQPLTGYKLNRAGMRPGADDYRNWPSRHLP